MVKITKDRIEFHFDNSNNQITPYPPIGTILLWGGDISNNIINDDYLLCNGQVVSITDYPELYNIIGSGYGTNNSFTMPDLRKRIPRGSSNSSSEKYGGVDTLNNTHYPHTHPSISLDITKYTDRRGAETYGSNRVSVSSFTSADISTSEVNIKANQTGTQVNYYPQYCIVNYIIRAK